ncbi:MULTISPECIES: transposase [unclassified Clostridium]|uniref:transposase n=1 Tax=unclassified Clostridium TaxID=2614128 RepID=UPI0023792DAF|nr:MULTISPECIES: transposase [unclassified Clostridium]
MQLEKVYVEYPKLKVIIDLVNEFRNILKYKQIHNLTEWINKVLKLKIRQFNSFANGLNRDIEAVKNAIIYDYNNVLAERCINKIKLIKRIMFGRCSFETLRTKTLNLEYYRKIN